MTHVNVHTVSACAFVAHCLPCSLLAVYSFADSGELECGDDGADRFLRYKTGSGGTCAGTAAALNSMVKEFTGPGGRTETIVCYNAAWLTDASNCGSTQSTLNDAIDAYNSGFSRSAL